MKFQIDITIRKIVKEGGLKIIHCDKPRALGEIIRHNYNIPSVAIRVWGHGVTLFDTDFQQIKHLFKGFKIENPKLKSKRPRR